MHTRTYSNSDPPITRSVFLDGFTLITARVPSLFVAANLVFAAGSLDDGDLPGTAHFLEHMLYEGPSRDSVHPYFRKLFQHGARAGAGTNWHDTEYYASGFVDQTEAIVRALMRIGFGAPHDFENLERERKVIAQEIILTTGRPGWKYVAWKNQGLYPAYPALQIRPAGTLDSLAKITADHLHEFQARFYKPSAAALVVTGDISHNDVLRLLVAHDVGPRVMPVTRHVAMTPLLGHETYHHSSSVESVTFFTPVFTQVKERRHGGLLFDLIADPPYGLLFQKLRTEEGLVYKMANLVGDWFMPLYQIEVTANRAHFDHIEESLTACLERIAAGNIPDDLWRTVLAARRRFFAAKPFSSEGTWNNRLTTKWLAGSLHEDDSKGLILGTTRGDISRLAEKILKRGRFGRIDIVHE